MIDRFNLISIGVLAVLYGVAGWFGTLLAVPPGYATVVWPASGIALAALVIGGRRLWPGILIGSFVVNASIGGVFTASTLPVTAIWVALSIAIGSTLQALTAHMLLRWKFGRSADLQTPRDIATLAALSGPIPCLIAATVGVATLSTAGILPADAIARNWLTWWFGDVIGIVLVLPLAILNSWRPWNIRWQGRPLARLNKTSIVALLVPIALTFYAWKLTTEIAYEKNVNAFSVLADDSERALVHRIEFYKHSLDSGAGLFRASEDVKVEEWRDFVDELDIQKTLPGINGIGYIADVEKGETALFLERAASDGVTDLRIRPETTNDDQFIIKYIEPIAPNLTAVGLNIAFEENRRNAAIAARDTGLPTITRKILLVQDQTKSPGFLLLRPFYDDALALETVDDRRKAFRGWTYAPFIANNFMADMTASQGQLFNMTVYGGRERSDDALIYSSAEATAPTMSGQYEFEKQMAVMGQEWTVVWNSTAEFDASVVSKEPLLILVGGVLLSLLFGALLYVHARREETIRRTVELQTSEIAAREQENKSIFRTAVVGFVILDEAHRVVSVNAATEAIFKRESSSLQGMTLATMLDDASAARQILTKAPGEHASVAMAPFVINAGGDSPIYLDAQRNEWRTESGKLRHTIILRDVTFERRIVSALERAERRWTYALEGAKMGVFDIDLRTGVSFVSNTWKAMLGFGPDEEIDPQAEWLARVHPDDLHHVQECDRACFENRAERSQSEYRIRHRDGHWVRFASDAMITERDSNGAPLRMIGTQSDITDLRNAQDALLVSEERFRLAIDNAPVGMALRDIDGRWIKVNEAFCRMLGYSMADVQAMSLTELTHPDDRDGDHEQIAELVAGTRQFYQIERRFLHRDGRAIWCLYSASLIENEGTERYFVTHFQDINDRKEIDRVKGEFIATVSHELRTPLTSIRGSLGLILGTMGKQLPINATNLLTIAQKNSERLIELINDILDLESAASGKMNFEWKVETLDDLVEQAVETNQPYFERYGVTAKILPAADPIFVEVDPRRFLQVMTNLLSNAAKFSPEGGDIEIAILRENDSAVVEVRDRGPGISLEFSRRIFGRFSQADSSATRQKGGTGLGLNITKEIVERMGGTVGYQNREGGGTAFKVTFPIVSDHSAGDVHPQNIDRPEAPALLVG